MTQLQTYKTLVGHCQVTSPDRPDREVVWGCFPPAGTGKLVGADENMDEVTYRPLVCTRLELLQSPVHFRRL